jgi:DNA processing protein
MADAAAQRFHRLRFAYVLSAGAGLPNPVIKNVLLSSQSAPDTLSELREAIYRLVPLFPPDLSAHWDDFEKVAARHRREGVEMLALTEEQYPSSLLAIVDPPPILYVRGDVGLLQSLPGAAVVGTRKASENGLRIAQRIAAFLSQNGYVVVSGLALGIDAAAHRGALSVRAPNIAVLAHGLHKYAPPRNAPLADEIIAAGGAVLSEHPLGRQPQPAYFVARNRIQIGLSAGSVIVEGEIKSGTMTQAEFCLRERRALFAVVPDAESSDLGLVSTGPQSLVVAGKAQQVRGKQDYEAMLQKLTAVRTALIERDRSVRLVS